MEPSHDLAVQVASLRKVYSDVVAVDDVSFTVGRGSIFCMIGPNGAGKNHHHRVPGRAASTG